MKNSSVPVQNADSNSTHKFPWKWYLSGLKTVNKNGKKVFSCFSCGGGSTMGYKLAGFDVIGNCEIDPDMIKIYRENHHPKYSYLMDVRDFLKKDDLPEELYNLDILDGSPPCSVFSDVGDREQAWGKKKVFREGQKAQTLDDLFFTFIDIAKKFQPKIIIAENVTGLIKGNAKGYVNEIIRQIKEAGYRPQIFLLNAAKMGVPQKRERVFFICLRNDIDLPKLNLAFNEPPIIFGTVRTENGKEIKDGIIKALLKYRKISDDCVSDISERVRGIRSGFSHKIVRDDKVAYTLVSKSPQYRMVDGMYLSDADYSNIQTFPQDYNFMGENVQYVCGMSVPPVMMANIASEVYEQWLKQIDKT